VLLALAEQGNRSKQAWVRCALIYKNSTSVRKFGLLDYRIKKPTALEFGPVKLDYYVMSDSKAKSTLPKVDV